MRAKHFQWLARATGLRRRPRWRAGHREEEESIAWAKLKQQVVILLSYSNLMLARNAIAVIVVAVVVLAAAVRV